LLTMADLSRPDLCIVGAGALGLALAEHAQRLGASVMLVDRGFDEPGDASESALRLAALSQSAARARAQRNNAEFGLAASEPKVSLKSIQERATRLVAARAPLASAERLAALGISVVRGEPRFLDQTSLAVGESQIKAGTTILALGSKPIVPAIPGLDQIDAFDVDSVLGAARKLSHLLVIGSDASAFVLAQVFARLGSAVTLVPQGPALDGFDSEAAAILLAVLAEEGVRIIDGGMVSAIHPRAQGTGAVVVLPSGEEDILDVSHVLVAMGGRADIAALDPAAARLRPSGGSAGSFVTGELGQTSNRRVRLVGPAAGIAQGSHAMRHGRAVVEAVLLGAPRQKPGPEPRMLLTQPPLVQIGRFAGASDKTRPGTTILRATMAENEMALALGEARGLVKLLVDSRGAVTGASLVGPGVEQLCAILTLALERGLPLEALADLSMPHPSVFSTLSTLADNYSATRPVSSWAARKRALRRIIPG
jgi:pyruvate/2-oxoglutarate dehydrogenase complex dihydrolipoamide dehydrogenase (E3) component